MCRCLMMQILHGGGPGQQSGRVNKAGLATGPQSVGRSARRVSWKGVVVGARGCARCVQGGLNQISSSPRPSGSPLRAGAAAGAGARVGRATPARAGSTAIAAAAAGATGAAAPAGDPGRAAPLVSACSCCRAWLLPAASGAQPQRCWPRRRRNSAAATGCRSSSSGGGASGAAAPAGASSEAGSSAAAAAWAQRCCRA